MTVLDLQVSLDDKFDLTKSHVFLNGVQAVLRRLVLLFWGVQVAFYASRGSWYIGVLAGLLQWAAWRCLCWGLRWVRQGVWRGIDVVHAAVLAWWSTRRRTS